MSKKVKFPKHVTVGAFKVELVKIPHSVAYDSSDYQGSFVSQPPAKIFLDEDIVDEKDEEHIVNSYGNFFTEVLMRSELKEWLLWQIKNA